MKLLALALMVPMVVAVAGSAIGASDPPPPVRAVRLAQPIAVDGVLSEPVWQSDNAVTDFKQRDPVEGAAPSQRSEVRVAYDEDAVYVGARLYDSAPDSILARLSRRDVSVPADRFSVYLDPYHDRRSGYYFLVNAAGTLFDGTLSNDGWEDASWDGVWDARVHRDQQGWSAEIRIPFSQLRFQRNAEYVWGVNFRRVVQRRNEEIFLVYQPKKESGFVSRFPELVGIEDVHPSRSIELRPYVTTKAEYLRHETLDPFNDGTRLDPNGGADLRMGVGSRLTLNATVNPDFGQVEVDPAVVNLSDVESFFDEKRPFFVEGSSNFKFGQEGSNSYWGFNWPQPTFFYSRRIGRAPGRRDDRWILSDVRQADYRDAPFGTTILGAAKLTGKLTPSWNFGSLHALTASESADLATGGLRSGPEIEPLTYYGVARGLREFKDRRQGLGTLTTVVARSFRNHALEDALNGQAVTTGLDGWFFLDKNQTWVISGYTAMSHVRGNRTRITNLQRDPRHYFQRPDADHIEVDPNATSLTGYASRFWLNKQKGSTFMNAALGFISPSFEVNDIGFQSRADLINGHVGYGYKWTETTRHRKHQDVLGAGFWSYDFQGNPVWGGFFAEGNTEFSNNYSWSYRTAYNPRTVNTRRTRGGPLTLNPPGYEFGTYFDTDSKAKLFYSFDTYTYFTEAGYSEWAAFPAVEWKPVSNVQFRVGPGIERLYEPAQYVDTITDPSAIQTYGSRYVFATLDQSTVSANIRLNWAFTPNLSLQTFIQPLISSGNYKGFKSLARPRSYAFEPYVYADNPDFNFKSLRGNAVMRWEYSPGSTLFLVWTQDRTDFENIGDFNFGPSSRRLLDAQADNIFLVKLTYYLNK